MRTLNGQFQIVWQTAQICLVSPILSHWLWIKNYNYFQTNGVAIKTENSTDRNPDVKQENIANVTIKQEPGEGTTAPVTNGVNTVANGPSSGNTGQLDIKQETMKPPPEKKPRLN